VTNAMVFKKYFRRKIEKNLSILTQIAAVYSEKMLMTLDNRQYLTENR
jgi:hypothetical protein